MRKALFILLLLSIGMSATAQTNPKPGLNITNDVDSIRITYGYLIGYATYRSTACYAFHKKAYKLQIEKSSDIHNVWQLPKTISKESVSKLLNDCNLYSTEDRCEFIKITKHDYSNYIKIINDKDSLDYYLPLAYDFIFDFMKNLDAYKLKEDAFLSLSCDEIINILESPHIFADLKPMLIIELISKNAGRTTIAPQWYFDDTAWEILTHGKKMYVANEYPMSFLKDIQYDRYVDLQERFYLLFQIAQKLVIDKNGNHHVEVN